MSVVPLLLHDWWDDMDRPARLLDQHFGLGLRRDDLLSSLPGYFMRPAGYIRPWRTLGRQESGLSHVSMDKDKFLVTLDVQQFSPNEITVKTVNNCVVIEGKHEEKEDEHGFISRQFMRRYMLPNDADASDVVSSLSSDGVLTITAPKKEPLPVNERLIPVVQTGTPAMKSESESLRAKSTENKVQPVTQNIK